MKNYSLTITGLLVVFLGMIIDDKNLVNQLAADIVTISGLLISWYGRWRQGDITLLGKK